MSTIRLNHRQREWLQGATQGQRNAWLAKGPIEIGSYLDQSTDEAKEIFRAHIRGVVVGEFGADQKAVELEAGKILEKIRQGPQEPVDEEALGIGTVNQEIPGALEDATVSFEQVFHLGALLVADGHIPDGFLEFIEEIDERTAKELETDLPWVGEFMKEVDPGTSRVDREMNAGRFLELAMHGGTLGFLVQVSHPVMDFDASGASASFSWGYYGTRWVYAESIREVATKAVAWAKEDDEASMQKAMRKASAHG